MMMIDEAEKGRVGEVLKGIESVALTVNFI